MDKFSRKIFSRVQREHRRLAYQLQCAAGRRAERTWLGTNAAMLHMTVGPAQARPIAHAGYVPRPHPLGRSTTKYTQQKCLQPRPPCGVHSTRLRAWDSHNCRCSNIMHCSHPEQAPGEAVRREPSTILPACLQSGTDSIGTIQLLNSASQWVLGSSRLILHAHSRSTGPDPRVLQASGYDLP